MSEKLCEHGILEGDFCSECFEMNDEGGVVNHMDLMCEESLPPELFAKWEAVRLALRKTRRYLKHQLCYEPTTPNRAEGDR